MKNSFIFNLAFVISFLFIGAACNQSHISTTSIGQPNTRPESIMNGLDADMISPQARAVVQVKDSRRRTSCTGTLISQNIVLTAAHCALGAPQDTKIFFDVFNGEPRYTRQVTAVVPHEKYQAEDDGNIRFSDERADIAVLRFKGDLPKGYFPISLPEKTDQWAAGQEFLALGFGRVAHKQSPPGKLLGKILKAKSLLANQNDFQVDQRASGGICPGDSGGPAMLIYYGKILVIGVASWIAYPQGTSEDEELCQFDALYTNVAFYREWIDQKIQSLQ